MVRHPFLEIACHSSKRLVVDGNMIRIDAKHLRPAFATGVFEIAVDISKRLVDLRIDLCIVYACLRVPATYFVVVSLS
jgi:hypothetical protein